MIITIDGGTTNTRITLLEGDKIVDRIKLSIGAGSTKNGDNSLLVNAVKDGIKTILNGNRVDAIIASGMIGSEIGLMEIPHISAPVTKEKLKENIVKTKIEAICDTDFYFIPGIKCHMENSELADIMRGEETEFFGLMKAEGIEEDVVCVLPGSHGKIINYEKGEIKDFYTTISGEMLASLSKNTILKNSFPNGLSKEIDEAYLIKGYETAKETGMSRTLFHIRVMKNFFGIDEIKLSSYFCGAVLYDDIRLIANVSGNKKIMVGGSVPLKNEYEVLIKYETGMEVTTIKEENAEFAVTYGALDIFKE